MPRFSIIVPAYNASTTLRETLDAMLQQTFVDWECVVVNDGSTDDTAEIVRSYVERDARFVLVNQQNTGTAGAYRTGVNRASADLLVICASDDMLLPRHLAVMDELIRREPDYDLYSCNGELLFHETGERTVRYTDDAWQQERSLTFAEVIEACFFSVGTVFRRDAYVQTGGHRLGVYVDDYDFWLRAMAVGATHRYTPEVLSVHRLSGFQQSASAKRVLESDIEVYENLIASGQLDAEHVDLARLSIAMRRRQIVELAAKIKRERRTAGVSNIARRVLGRRITSLAGAVVRRCLARRDRRLSGSGGSR